MRAVVVASVVSGVVSSLLTVLLLGGGAREAEAQIRPGTVIAQQFILVDEDDRVRGGWSAPRAGSTQLYLDNGTQTARVLLSAGGEDAGLSMVSGAPPPSRSDPEAMLGGRRVGVQARRDASTIMVGSGGNERVLVSADEQGTARIGVLDANGRLMWLAP